MMFHINIAALKTISKLLFPKSALLFEEESWNCYPYTRTKYKHKLFKSFNIDIESKYQADCGQCENAFNLSKSELSSRVVGKLASNKLNYKLFSFYFILFILQKFFSFLFVSCLRYSLFSLCLDYIDIVNDQINANEYKSDEDPALFVSSKTSRGPLCSEWLDELKENSRLNNKPCEYMCAYKLCRIECAFWGCQSRVEKLISESVLRHMILVSHRQAWCWQDEYVDLTIDDVRELEAETQKYLNMKMRNELISESELLQQQLKRPSASGGDLNVKKSSVGDAIQAVGGPSKRKSEKKKNSANSSIVVSIVEPGSAGAVQAATVKPLAATAAAASNAPPHRTNLENKENESTINTIATLISTNSDNSSINSKKCTKKHPYYQNFFVFFYSLFFFI
jgi:hypothetical protein